MIFQSRFLDEDIIHKNQYKLSHERAKYGVHQALEGFMCICEAKRHYSELKMSMMSFKYCFELILCNHSYLMKPRVQIQFSEVFGTSNFI
jgi:hypothetical protein